MEAPFAESILRTVPVAVAIDNDGVIRFANTAAEAFFGGALVGSAPCLISSLVDGLRLRGGACEEEVTAFNIQSRSEELNRLQARLMSGATVPIDIKAARFSDAGEDFVTLVIQDVTAVLAAETAIQELRHQINHNWRLNSLGEMASMLAHELNQPLSAIANHLHAAQSLLARDEHDVPAVSRSILSAEGQAQRAGDTIRRLRALMSRDTGFHKAENVAEVVDEIMPILAINARELDAEIVSHIPSDHYTDCDRIQVQQLIFNLVRNAIEAPATRHPRRVRIIGQCHGHGAYRLVVEDNGPGVAPEIRDDLFGPLASTKPDGMGLGLSICRTIAEAHRGTLAYSKSSLGGAAFVLTLNEIAEGRA